MLNLQIDETPSHAQPAFQLPASNATVGVRRMQSAGWAETDDEVIQEMPVAFIYNGLIYTITDARAGDLEDFALGFSFAEGLVAEVQDLHALAIHPEAGRVALDITLAPERRAALQARLHNPYEEPTLPELVCGSPLRVELIDRCLRELATRRVPGLAGRAPHFALWSDFAGETRVAREDIQLHHALDKLSGALLRQQHAAHDGFVLCSGSASASTVRRVVGAGLSALVLTGAPTARAIEVARAAGLLLIGLARPGHLVAYTQTHRLAGALPPG